MNATVEYRDVPGHPGYRVGTDGSVWSRWRHGPNSVMLDTWRQLKAGRNGDGYPHVTLVRPHRAYYHVHQLVLLAFVGPCPDGMEVCHFPDRNPANNNLDNLRYGTRQDNYTDSTVHGTAPKGERHGNAKLTEELVRSIRTDHATGNYSERQLAAKYNVSRKTIANVVGRKIWRHVA